MTQGLENRITAMEAKLQTLETFLPALLSRFEQSETKLETKLAQNAQESRQDRNGLEARLEQNNRHLESKIEQASREMREGRRAAFYFGIGTIIALFTLAAAVYFGFQNLGAGA